MSMTASTIRYYTDREKTAYQKISGMNEVLSAKPADMETVSAKFPDAAFAIMIHDEMVCGIRGVRNIVQKAHAAIMDGENMENIRFRYTKEMDEYSGNIPGMINIDKPKPILKFRTGFSYAYSNWMPTNDGCLCDHAGITAFLACK